MEFLNNDVAFGSDLSSYAKNIATTPLRLKISENCADGRRICLVIKATCDNITEQLQQEIILIAENGIELNGLVSEDLTLTSNNTYIIDGNFAVAENATLTIEEGTTLKFRDHSSFICYGNLNAIGRPGKMITFTAADHSSGITKRINVGNNSLEYVRFHNLRQDDSGYFFIEAYNNKKNLYGSFSNCIIRNMYDVKYGFNGIFYYCNINSINNRGQYFAENSILDNCNLISNQIWSSIMTFANAQNSNVFDNKHTNYDISNSVNLIPDINEPVVVSMEHPNYLGTGCIDKAYNYIADINHNVEEGIIAQVDLSNMLTQPNPEAHGIVWKVVVNGYDAQDEFEQLPPLGVGRHKFEVYFNRPMNKEVVPQISFGVRDPYTQQPIAEDGSWNEEGTIYTAYKTITGKTKSDGLNRIYVYGAEDEEYFEIPDEKTRFNIIIQAAGSMATGFAAEAELGRVKLTWNNDDNNFDDAMGFNIYRYTEETIDNPTRINEEIVDIETTEYTDYEVTPGTTYYYMYKVLSTDLQEYDVSNVVAVTPLTSTKGDANGSGDVDVADVITTVNYAAGQHPKPFIFEAADMNDDLSIDILDIIGIIKNIIHQGASTNASVAAVATYTIEDGIIYVDSPVEVAGVQIQLACSTDEGLKMQEEGIRITDDMKGFEHTSAWLSDNDYLFLGYNMNGKTLTAGKHAILVIGNAQIADIRLSDAYGHNIMAESSTVDKIDRMACDVMTVKGIYDMQGRKLSSKADDVKKLPKGIYIVNGGKVVK